MNILQILPELEVGGVERGTMDLAKHLVELGHKAVVISNGGHLVKDLEAFGAIHYKLPVHKKSLFSIIRMVFRVSEIIVKENIDIVHARSRVPAWVAYYSSRRTKKVFVTTCHGYYRGKFLSSVMGWAKEVIVPSNVIATHMINDFGVFPERVRLIPRSVDLTKFIYTPYNAKEKKEFNVGIVARITPLKGHVYFIKAMAEVAKVVPNLKVWIVGEASASKMAYKEQLRVLVKRLGIWQNTEFLGTQKDVPGILKHLDVLVLPSITHEAFGRVIIEAQASGVPVVATAVGGVVDVIEDNKTGIIVPAADSFSIAEAVMRIFKDPVFAYNMAEKAYKKVKEEYSLERMVENTLKVYRDALGNFKIGVIKLSSLGDIILSTAAIRSLRDKFKRPSLGDDKNDSYPKTEDNRGYKISFIVGKESKDILLGCPYLDEILVYDYKDKEKGFGGLLRMASVLKKSQFDIIIDLQNNRKSHILTWLARAPKRYGYDNKKLSFFLNHKILDDRTPLDPVSHQFKILEMLGIEKKDPRLELWPSAQDEQYVRDFFASEWLNSAQKLIGINISASPRWSSKVWPLEHIVKLCEKLALRDFRIVITGTDKEHHRAQNLINKLRQFKIMNACGKTTINQLSCLIRRCCVYISGDSAPLHVAAAAGVPLIALFGPTDPQRHLPPAGKCIVFRKKLSCSPCYRPRCNSMKCLKLIYPDDIISAVEELIIS